MEMAECFQGKALIMLDDYFENKIKLAELKTMIRRFPKSKEIQTSIERIEKEIRTFISSLNTLQLRQIIYMSLDFKNLEV